MAVLYRLYQLSRNNTKFDGKWYGRAVHRNVVDLDGLAEIIESNCTVKRSDILAVLSELVVTMNKEMLNGNRVKIDGLGSFKICMRSTCADTEDAWTVTKNVKGKYIHFKPETKDTFNNGTRTRTVPLLADVKFEPLIVKTSSSAAETAVTVSDDGTVSEE